MFPQYALIDFIFITLYGGVTLLSIAACCYILFRRANAIAPGVKPPLRLRRYAAAFFGALAVSHVWWMLFYYSRSTDESSWGLAFCTLFDFLVTLPALVGSLLAMLQDRRRSLWPLAIPVGIAIVLLTLGEVFGFDRYVTLAVVGILLALELLRAIGRAVRQYGRWLRDHYADLEHKEVWQTLMVLGAFMVLSLVYFTIGVDNLFMEYIVQVVDLLLIVQLLWRVETMPPLVEPSAEPVRGESSLSRIGALLEKRCENERYYLNHDVSLSQLAEHIGTNSKYLSQYLSQQGMTYNSYINGLRIQYFVSLYRDAVASKRDFTARQLAAQSGFRSYSTFSAVFKQTMGKTVTDWMRYNSTSEMI